MACLAITTLFFLTIFSIKYNYSLTAKLSSSSYLFANELFHSIEKKSTENIVYSPASIYSSLALAYMGAAGQTASEIRTVLKLNQVEERNFSSQYGNTLKTTFKKIKRSDNEPQLSMANGVYVSNNLKIADQFYKTAEKIFDCKVENVDFSKAITVVEKINKWVKEKTENKILNILKPNAVNQDTRVILVNAIYFKAKWETPFLAYDTRKYDFHIGPNKTISVDTMYSSDVYNYAELSKLNAQAVEIPYQNSDISMLVILPNDIDGLEQLKRSLNAKELKRISSRMSPRSIDLYMPKFRLEFDIDLKETLKKMGLSSVFEQSANLTGIFDSRLPQGISDMKHKALFECTEDGTEAPTDTFTFYMNRAGGSEMSFRVNHPFVFVIRNKSTIFLMGHVAKF